MTSIRFARVSMAATAAFLLSGAAAQAEVSGECAAAVGTFLTTNTLKNEGKTGTSRSLLVLTNGGHALRFDSDERGAAMDDRPFGDSAGTWRCDGVDEDGTVRLTVVTLDFTYAVAEGEDGQIARIDTTGTYTPKTGAMALDGKLGLLPWSAAGQAADALSKAETVIAISFRGARVELPPAP